MCYMFLFIGNTHKKLLPEFSQILEQSLTEHQFIFYVRSLNFFFFSAEMYTQMMCLGIIYSYGFT